MANINVSGGILMALRAKEVLKYSWKMATEGRLTLGMVRGKPKAVQAGKLPEFSGGLIDIVMDGGGPAKVGTTWEEVQKLYAVSEMAPVAQMKVAQDHLNSNLLVMENPTFAAKLEFAA